MRLDRAVDREADDHEQRQRPQRERVEGEPLPLIQTIKRTMTARLIACQATRRSIASTP
jgi:hypothetical protein